MFKRRTEWLNPPRPSGHDKPSFFVASHPSISLAITLTALVFGHAISYTCTAHFTGFFDGFSLVCAFGELVTSLAGVLTTFYFNASSSCITTQFPRLLARSRVTAILYTLLLYPQAALAAPIDKTADETTTPDSAAFVGVVISVVVLIACFTIFLCTFRMWIRMVPT